MENINQVLKKKKFLPSKKMGQNFLSNQFIINEICNFIPDVKDYDAIVEIGPGLGAITTHLSTLQRPLFCIELDKRLYADLKVKFAKSNNTQIINNDFLEIDLYQLLGKYKNILVVANIPYSITTPIILKCLKFNKIKTLYLMVQKEVAIKWVYSKKSNRNASTNIINYYYDVKKILDIKNTNFTPIPKVDSAMVLLNRKLDSEYDEQFYKFMKPFFLHKRKKMINNTPANIDKNKLLNQLIKMGFNSNTRAEELDYNQWLKLYKIFDNKNEN